MVFAVLAGARAEEQKKPLAPGEIILLGKLTRVMAIGGETTGWSLELKSETAIEGEKLTAIEVSGFPKKLARLANQDVRVRGFVMHHHGVERKDWLVLELTAIHAIQPKPVKGD